MKYFFIKLLIFSMLFVLLLSCKSKSNLNYDREDTPNEAADEQLEEYEQDMRQQNGENYH